jgi:hypothetical protein
MDRLIDVTAGAFRRLSIKILEPHDLVLSKVSRNSGKDRDDARMLIDTCALSRNVLRERFEAELLPYLQTAIERTSLTMELLLEECFAETSE